MLPPISLEMGPGTTSFYSWLFSFNGKVFQGRPELAKCSYHIVVVNLIYIK